ncbi:NAD(P)H-quinone oxidoreductase [Coralliovum pocilloporae]|uniref:NAD(P)H-quinone oxidoreductase n=1 Tax=Coralliovum pocilloporae TaxID=3066369 RepID=UPI0033079F78
MTQTIPQMMTGISILQPGSADVLVPQTFPVPAPGNTDVLIRVSSAGVNRPDVLQRQGLYPPPPGASDIPGLEVCGTIAALGRDVTGWAIGDRVIALVTGGGYAEYCLADQLCVLPVPRGLSDEEAAALPETYFTVWSTVFQRAGLKPGETILVHGGTSGIGTTALQLARQFGAKVFASAGSDEKCAVCLELGASIAINYNSQDFVEVTQQATDGHGMDVILDMVGGDYISRNYEAAALEGRIIQIAFLNGAISEADFSRLMLKRLVHTGATLRARSAAFKGTVATELKAHVWPLLEDGSVKPVMDSSFPLEEAAKAHAHMESSTHIGKIVITV